MKNIKLSLVTLLVAAAVIGKAQTLKPGELPVKQVAQQINTQKNVQILDARSNEEFLQHHIPGAVSADAGAANYRQVIAGLSINKPTFIYSIGAGRSTKLAAELKAKGFKDVNVVAGGLSSWIGAGYAVTTNKKALPLTRAKYNAITNSSSLVLVDFGSKYCPGCKKLLPTLDSLKANKAFTAKIVNIEEYDSPKLAHELSIQVLPTLVLYQNNKEVWRKSGQSSTLEIAQVVNATKAKLASAK